MSMPERREKVAGALGVDVSALPRDLTHSTHGPFLTAISISPLFLLGSTVLKPNQAFIDFIKVRISLWVVAVVLTHCPVFQVFFCVDLPPSDLRRQAERAIWYMVFRAAFGEPLGTILPELWHSLSSVVDMASQRDTADCRFPFRASQFVPADWIKSLSLFQRNGSGPCCWSDTCRHRHHFL